MTAPTIWARVMADTVQFQEGMAEVKKSLKQVGEQVRAAGEQIRSVAVDFAKWGAAAVAAAAAAGAAIVKSSLDSIRELKNLSTVTGLTVAEFQRGAYAAQQYGIEQDKFADILKDVNDKIGDFMQVGSGPMADFFENIAPKVGVTADMFKDLNSQQALGLYVQSLERANLSQAEMTFYMEALAGDSTKLLPLLENNAKAFRTLDEEARKLNIGLNSQQVAQALEAQKKIATIWSDLKNQVTIFVADISPLITSFLEVVQENFRKFAGNAEDSFDRAMLAVKSFGEGLAFLADVMRGIAVFFEAVKTGAIVLYTAFVNIAAGMAKVGVAIQEHITAPLRGAEELFHGFRVLLAAGFFDPFIDQLRLVKAVLTDALVTPLVNFLELAAKLPDSVGGDMFKDALQSVKQFQDEARGVIAEVVANDGTQVGVTLNIDGEQIKTEAASILGNIGEAVITGDFSQVTNGFTQMKDLANKTISDVSSQVAVIEGTVKLDTTGTAQDIENVLRSVGSVSDQYIAGLNSATASFSAHADEMTGVAIESAAELNASMLETMPSNQINAFFDNWIARSKEARAAMVGKEESTADTSGTVDEFGSNSAEVPDTPRLTALQAYETETIGLLEAMGMRYQMQEEFQLAQYDRELELLNAQLANKEIAQKEHADKVAEIERQKADTQRQMTVATLEEGFAALSNNSKKVEKLMRGVAIAQALIKGQQAAVDAWQAGMATGGPTAPLFAAAYTAASLARTGAMIASLRGGGSASSGGGGGASIPSVNSGSAGNSGGQQAQPVSQRVFNVEFRGESGMGTQQTRKLLELINEQAGDNVAINLRG